MKMEQRGKIEMKKEKEKTRDFFNIDKFKFIKEKIIGGTPGVDSEVLGIFCKNFNFFLNNVNYEDPADLFSNFLKNVDFYVDWIKDALYAELEKTEGEQLKNIELKRQLGVVIQNLVDSLSGILETKRVGYLLELIIQKDINILLSMSGKSKINIPDDIIDKAISGDFSMEASILANIPNYRGIIFKERYFEDEGDVFKVEMNSVYRKEESGKKTPIEEITKYTSINPKLVTSENIINLTSFDDLLAGNFELPISEIPLKEKLYLYNFLLTNNLYQLHRFVSTYEKQEKNFNFFRTFLSIEHGGKEMGDKILTLGEKLPKDIAGKVFEKYGEIVDNVSKITEFARSNFTKEINTNPELIRKIEETLYQKGKQLLSGVCDDVNNQKEVNYKEIGNQLDRINADTITTFAIFKQAVKNGEKLPIESIEGAIFSKKEASEISNDQKIEMDELYDRNYINHPDREFIAKVKEYFNTAFIPEENKKKNYFYTFEKDDKMRAFVRFEEQQGNHLYTSALNVDEASKNFGLGEAMMDEALIREAEENILYATCLISNPSNMRYFEKGFISDHFKMVDKTNQFDLVWDEKRNTDILAKQKSIEELVSMYLKNNFEGSIEIKKKDSLMDLHESIPEGKALVRCFMDPIDKNSWYAIYEKLPEGYGLNMSEVE